jgi:predicted nucleic-acid-binding protein
MRAIDTNVLIRMLIGDDARQTEAADRFIEKGAWVSILALAETVWVLRTWYERDATEVAAAVQLLLDHENLILQDSETVEAALKLYRSRPALGFSDCLMLHLARRAGHLPLGTFDRALGRVEGVQKL